MPKITARAVVALSAAAALVVGLAGCAGSEAQPSASESPIPGGTYTHAFSLPTALTSVDPPTLIFHEALQVVRALTDNLVDQDPDTGEVVPWLATSWKVNSDATVYTFTLRDGVTFSDGAVFDASAVKANFDRAVALGPKAVGAAPLLAHLSGSKVIDAHTIEFDFNQPAAYFLQALSNSAFGLISPKSIQTLSDADIAQGKYAGLGPFTLASYNPQTEIDLDKRADYNWPSKVDQDRGHTGAAYVDHLRFVEIGDAATRANQVIGDEIQSAALISFQDEARITATEGAKLLPFKIPGLTETLIINQQSFLGTDAPARAAIQLAIDTKTIVNTVFGPSYGPASSVLGSQTPGYADQSAYIAYDPDKAKKLLADDGWVAGADGILVKNGQRFQLDVPAIGSWAGGVLLQAQLKAVGIDLPLDKSDPATSAQKLASGNYTAHKWQMTRADPSVLYAVWSTPPTAQGYARANPSSLDALIKAQESTVDPTARAAAAAKVQEDIVKNHWGIPLDDRAWTYAQNATAHGLRADGETKLVFYNVWVTQP
jgi:peptide/nickel transport system substrate-binding protein